MRSDHAEGPTAAWNFCSDNSHKSVSCFAKSWTSCQHMHKIFVFQVAQRTDRISHSVHLKLHSMGVQ